MPDYQIWECQICGWLYDEAQGWPEDGIAPGTRWQDIPDDWCCPECGTGKADFAMVPQTRPAPGLANPPAAVAADEPIVILGTGLAGYHLAQELRKRDAERPLLLISQDDGSYYYKPHLSSGFHHNRSAADLARTSAADMAQQLKAEILTYTRAVAIDSQKKILSLEHKGSSYQRPFHSLVFATGAEAIKPPLAGDAAGEVVCVNDLQDYAHLRALTRTRRRILIMGAGLIGAEFCNDLLQSGFEVSVVDLLDRPLAQLAPAAIGAQVQAGLAAAGATFYFGQKVEQLQREGHQLRAQLSDGTLIHCDLVMAAVGVRPRTSLAEAAGIVVQRGIVTDACLRSSAPDIYALGDCAQTDGQVRLYVAPLLAAAKALACTLTGTPTPVAFGVMPIVVKTSLMPVCVCLPAPAAEGQWQTISADAQGTICHFLDKQNQLRGLALSGNGTRALTALIKQLQP